MENPLKGEKMFLGEFRHTLDAKGRIIIPSKFRESLGDEYVISRGLDGCLFLFPMEEWKSFEEKLRTLPITESRAFVRYFTASASDGSIDKQGRALIPQNLRDVASIDKNAVIIGTPNKLEIWSEDLWDQYMSSDIMSDDNIAKQMEELGF